MLEKKLQINRDLQKYQIKKKKWTRLQYTVYRYIPEMQEVITIKFRRVVTFRERRVLRLG